MSWNKAEYFHIGSQMGKCTSGDSNISLPCAWLRKHSRYWFSGHKYIEGAGEFTNREFFPEPRPFPRFTPGERRDNVQTWLRLQYSSSTQLLHYLRGEPLWATVISAIELKWQQSGPCHSNLGRQALALVLSIMYLIISLYSLSFNSSYI